MTLRKSGFISLLTARQQHGNKFSKQKRVEVTLRFNGNSFTGQVLDQGEGFDFQDHLSQSAPPNPMSERGRGIIIMKAFTDDLRFSYRDEVGLCVEIIKNSPDSAQDEPEDDE